MTILNIRNHSVEIDIEAELTEYDFGYGARWTADKLIASSPFREDNRASFFVNLEGDLAGTWADSGSLDEEYSRGNFVKLIALLRGISYEEACEYLLEKYGALYGIKSDEPIRLPAPKLREPARMKCIEANPITRATSPYLLSRGISEQTQAKFGIGYGQTVEGFTAIPWHSPDGRLANIKYRSTSGRGFFYEKGATPINTLVYGIDLAEEDCVLVEGEIDVMSFDVAGISAIAVAGAHLSREQADIIKRSRIRRLYLGGDNDAQGRQFNRQVERIMRGYVELFEIGYNEEKDANDVIRHKGVRGLRDIYSEASPIRAINLRRSRN